MNYKFLWVFLVIPLFQSMAWGMPTQVIYQGSLKQGSNPFTGTLNMEFMYVDEQGNQIPPNDKTKINTPVAVTNGLFSQAIPIPSEVDWQKWTPFIQLSINGQKFSSPQPINANIYSIVSQTVIDGGITTPKLAANSVTTPQLLDGSVTFAKLDPGSAQSVTIPKGLIAMFNGPCPMVGWKRFAPLDNLFPRGSDAAGTLGGSDTHSHSLKTSGTIQAGGGLAVGVTQGNGNGLGAVNAGTNITVDLKTSDTDTQDNVPKFLTMVFCEKQ